MDKHLWSQHGILIETKLKVYNICVLPSLLHVFETRATYWIHTKKLKGFHQQCILGVQLQMYATVSLNCSQITSLESVTSTPVVRWKIPKQFLYSEQDEGKKPVHKPKLIYEDYIKKTLKNANTMQNDWRNQALYHSSWDKAMQNGKRGFEQNCIVYEKLKRGIH